MNSQTEQVREQVSEHLSGQADSPADRSLTMTLTEASQASGFSKSQLRRALDAGKFPGATQDDGGVWQVPVNELRAAGFALSVDAPQVSQVIDLATEEAPQVPALPALAPPQLLETLSAWQVTFTDLARRLADAESVAAEARTRLELAEALTRAEERERSLGAEIRLQLVTAQLERALADLHEARNPRRWWSRHRRGEAQPAATDGEANASR